MNNNYAVINRIFISLLLIGLGIGIGYTVAIKTNQMVDVQPDTVDKTVLYWYDPMVPDQHFDKPGKSPFMDMELVPKYADASMPSDGIRIDSRIVQNIGVKLGVVEKSQISDIAVDDKASNSNDIFALQNEINDIPEKATSQSTFMRDGLVVPSEAVINTGRHTFVIVSESDGYFKPIKVTVGKEKNGKTEIVSGLREGDKIVVSGQFLIDSEANFSSAMNRMSNAGETP